jgi:hypothetical protein
VHAFALTAKCWNPQACGRKKLTPKYAPGHAGLVAGLCLHLQLSEPDDDVHRLAHSIVGLAIYMFVGRDVVHALAPQLQATPEAIDIYTDRLVDYAMAMVASEADRRKKVDILNT